MLSRIPSARQLLRQFAPRLGINFNSLSPGALGFRTRYDFKMVYFDRNIIRSNWKAMNATPLRRAANYVRKIARNSIRRDTRKKGFGRPSKPGTPPFARTGARTAKVPPFKMIYSDLELFETQAVIGMVWLGSEPPVPGLHEHGGTAQRVVYNAFDKSRNKPLANAQRVMRTVRYPKRPFMAPALVRAQPMLPSFWKDSIISRSA